MNFGRGLMNRGQSGGEGSGEQRRDKTRRAWERKMKGRGACAGDKLMPIARDEKSNLGQRSGEF